MFKIDDISMPPSNTQDLDLMSLETDFLPEGENDFNITKYLISEANNEETLDVAELKYDPSSTLPYNNFIPTSPHGPPERKDISGQCNFTVEIDGSLTQKKKFLYSHILNRIYVEMGCNFSVNFNWDVNKVPNRPMFIRATVVFSNPEQAEKRVERCLQHAHVSSNTPNMNQIVINNVLRSARELADPNVYYCGSSNETDCWYSVLVRFNGPTGHAYQFVCKNSCSSGINRRAIDVIFTLEDDSGNVFGRQSVGARVCSCPRRDKKQQEEEFQAAGTKRPMRPKQSPPQQPTSKKIKLEVVSDDDAVITLPQIDIVGPRAAISSLKVAHNMMDQMRASNLSHQQPVEELERTSHHMHPKAQFTSNNAHKSSTHTHHHNLDDRFAPKPKHHQEDRLHDKNRRFLSW